MNDHPADQLGNEMDAWGRQVVVPPGTELLAPPAEEGYAGQPGMDGGPPSMPSLAMFSQAKWWILAVFLLVSCVSVPALWVFINPVYEARSVVRVSPVVSRIAFNIEENGMIPLYSSYLNTQVSIIRSPAVLERVLDRADVRNTAWYGEKASVTFGSPLSTLERLQRALTVRPRPRTELIDVRVEALNAADVKILADAVVDEYERYSDETFREQDSKRSETLRNEKTALHNQILSLVDTKLRIAAQLGTTSATDLQSQLREGVSALETQHAEKTRDLEMVQWELEQFSAGEDGTEAKDAETAADGDPAAVAGATGDAGEGDTTETDAPPTDLLEAKSRRYARDAEWRQRSLQLESARHQLSVTRQQFGDAHPRIAQRMADVDYAERLLRTREVQVDEIPLNVAVRVAPVSVNAAQVVEPTVVDRASIELQRDRLTREVELLTEEISKQRRKLAEVGDLARDIATYDEEIRQKSELRNRLRDRLTQLDLESRAPARISIASHAIRPSRPVRDRRAMLSALAIAAALGLSVGGAYLRLVLDPRIREASEVRRALHVPFLGQLPPLSKSDDLLGECGNVIMMERIRMVRTSLLERLRENEKNVVLVTSSSSQTGKTSFSFLLGRSLALLGKKTLLVEADLRRPSLFRQLKVGSNVGLASLLVGTSEDGAAIVSTGVPNLDLITAGEQPGAFDPELLANGVFAACLKRWKKTYDFVLLDSPPVLPVADARILAPHADGTIMVLRSAHCRRGEVAQAYADLNAAGGNLLGTVLVGAPGHGRSGEYYGYDTYYDNDRILEAHTPPMHEEESVHA